LKFGNFLGGGKVCSELQFLEWYDEFAETRGEQRYGLRQHAAFGVFCAKRKIKLPLGQFEPKTQKSSASPTISAEYFVR
ncbi:MAG: hypothetical protein NC401_07130, partial [Ruminococcus sp.]|nr:hypothetical protein [Ruminococcus sp.]